MFSSLLHSSRSSILPLLILLLAAFPIVPVNAEDGADFEAWWLSHFRATSPPHSDKGLCHLGGELPAFQVTPSATGTQLVRVSLPFSEGSLLDGFNLAVYGGDQQATPDLRVLTLHPGVPKCVRRAILTFPWRFDAKQTQEFSLSIQEQRPAEGDSSADLRETTAEGARFRIGTTDIRVTTTEVAVSREGNPLWKARLLAPGRKSKTPPSIEWVEKGPSLVWLRLLLPDADWPCIIEVKADCLGTIAVRGHLERIAQEDGFAPDLGWRIEQGNIEDPLAGKQGHSVDGALAIHTFSVGGAFSTVLGEGTLSFPEAPLLRRGSVEVESWPAGKSVIYYRCRESESVPQQPNAWREASFVVSGPGQAPWTALDEPDHRIEMDAKWFDPVYGSGLGSGFSLYPDLDALERYHCNAIVNSALVGDDYGNITADGEGGPAPVFGMNRLNHCPPIFAEFYRSADSRLRNTAVVWCNNFYDLSIWWGKEVTFGGTRYNNALAAGNKAHESDTHYMWRSNFASHFCTKGFSSFWNAYEETGDPRMLVALKAQVDYAKDNIHAVMPPGEPRNIGDVADFLHLARYTGDLFFEDEAMRLFRDIRQCLTPENLFSQSCEPLVKNLPFIDDDAVGLKNPFVKPYIVGYALAGLPALAALHPTEDRLHDTVRAVADFQAAAQDPVGGWRYPHPKSSGCIISQGMEHAAQLCNAAAYLESRGEPVGNLLDAIERVLQARVLSWQKSGKVLSGLSGWERAAGIITGSSTLYDLYKKPEDRDPSRDYTEGSIGLGGSPPEGLVYFPTVLRFYLEHRPAERLFFSNAELSSVLKRIPDGPPQAIPESNESAVKIESASRPQNNEFERYAVHRDLPVFREARLEDMTFPDAFDPKGGIQFSDWKQKARQHLLRSYQTVSPRAAFSPSLVAIEDRGKYEARKIAFNISGYERIPAYVLVPKGKGPFPAILALHDHGAHFSIGKEKVIRPFAETAERIEDASKWVSASYGGRFIGDELAARGYVVFSMDALYWGDRGRLEGVSYEGQQAFASNLLQLGMSWAGIIATEDLRSVDFVAGLPEVDPERVGAIGLSMGAFRTWQLAAGTDHVKVGAAICWLGTTEGLVSPGNNQTVGQSAYSMLHPGLRNLLDYPDVAALACPKPMLFFNGSQDTLFPIASVEAAYAKMHQVWDSQHATENLVTKIWPLPHVFSQEMQEEAFSFLDRTLKPKSLP
jgi:dienelactone hydrolase